MLRRAIAIVTNGTLHTRNPAIWGAGTTACASDSKHFGAWDQNLTTQWHVRYGGRGVMIYWHVVRNSLCVHSQLKSLSSSEVASMIEGVVHHCTEMEIDRQYVDSPWSKHDCLRVLPAAGFPAHAAAEGASRSETVEARCGTRGNLS
jgi:TnpA family transposase